MRKIIKLSKKEAAKKAEQVLEGEECGFLGSLLEVWAHAEEVHNVLGSLQLKRLDGSTWTTIDEGSYLERDEVFVKQNTSEYWFLCLETHKHTWRKKNKKERKEIIIGDVICTTCSRAGYLINTNENYNLKKNLKKR